MVGQEEGKHFIFKFWFFFNFLVLFNFIFTHFYFIEMRLTKPASETSHVY